MSYTVQKISASATHTVRHSVLRVGKPLSSCQFEGDDLETTHHFGCVVDHQIVGVISLYEAGNPNLPSQKSFQIRGMAVLDAHQKKGFGEALMQKALDFCTTEKASLLWFNARSSAVGFYEKMGYAKWGAEFEIEEVGPHFVMYKFLQEIR